MRHNSRGHSSGLLPDDVDFGFRTVAPRLIEVSSRGKLSMLGAWRTRPTFSTLYLLLVSSVGPEAWRELHEYINGDTLESVFDDSSGKPRLKIIPRRGTDFMHLPSEISILWVRGRTCHPPLFHRLLPLIAHWPAIARWNRDDESIYKLKQLIKTYVIERSWELF